MFLTFKACKFLYLVYRSDFHLGESKFELISCLPAWWWTPATIEAFSRCISFAKNSHR